MEKLTERDRNAIWHPYTQMKTAAAPIPVVRGEGVYLFDHEGKKYIDAISSWWVNLHGHAHPYLAKKLYDQAKQLEHVMFAGFTHLPAIQLAERLLELLPAQFKKIFYSDNGSTAVEVALKMAIQSSGYKRSMKSRHRKKIVALKNSYHGDTFGAMSVSERGVFSLPFQDYLFEVTFIDAPTDKNIDDIKKLISKYSNDILCFIYEPLLQGAGGMKMYKASALDKLINLFRRNKIICIADEVMTGFYRTGKLFASEYMKSKPDIICLSKGLTGGMMAMGVTACTQEIYEAFLSDDRSRTFFHGHSYTANPLACASANASLDLLQTDQIKLRINDISKCHENFLKLLKSRMKDKIKNPRMIGSIVAFELISGTDDYLNQISAIITKSALNKGIVLRPLGNTIYVMPPYCITGQQLQIIYDCILEIVNESQN